MTRAPLELLVIPAFVDRAVTDAPLRALVPISILTVPVADELLERFPREITPEPEMVILSVGRIRPVTMTPLMVPLALDPTNVSFQLIGEESHPLDTTVPVPIWDAVIIGASKISDKSAMRARRRRNNCSIESD